MSDVQHGFRSNYSTVTNFLDAIDEITYARDNKDTIDLMCIDFSRAFNSVSCKKYYLY